MRRAPFLVVVVVVAVLLAACGGSGAAGNAPIPATPVATPEPTRSDADKGGVIGDSIDELYCTEAPKETWCPVVARNGKAYAVEVDRTTVFVFTKLADTAKARKLAKAMCSSIAIAHFDENGFDLGVRHIHIWDPTGAIELAKCNTPRY